MGSQIPFRVIEERYHTAYSVESGSIRGSRTTRDWVKILEEDASSDPASLARKDFPSLEAQIRKLVQANKRERGDAFTRVLIAAQIDGSWQYVKDLTKVPDELPTDDWFLGLPILGGPGQLQLETAQALLEKQHEQRATFGVELFFELSNDPGRFQENPGPGGSLVRVIKLEGVPEQGSDRFKQWTFEGKMVQLNGIYAVAPGFEDSRVRGSYRQHETGRMEFLN